MPSEIDTMMYSGSVPWHGQGTRLDNPATAREAITAAGLDWDVQLQPLYTGHDKSVRVQEQFCVARQDRLTQPDGGQLGVVGKNYTPLQNRAAFSFLDPVVARDEAVYHTAGALRGGRRIWLLAKLPGQIRIIGDDIAEKFILLSSSHDGSTAVRIGLTPIRVVCQNTLNVALRGLEHGVSFRHTADVANRVQDAANIMGLVNHEMEKAGQVMQQMAVKPLDDQDLTAYFRRVLPQPQDERAVEGWQFKQQRLLELAETGIGADLPGVRGSLWAAYNGLTQWVDRESYSRRNHEPLNSIWFGAGEQIKRRAFNEAQLLLAA